jgi:uncharacterized membrane protein
VCGSYKIREDGRSDSCKEQEEKVVALNGKGMWACVVGLIISFVFFVLCVCVCVCVKHIIFGGGPYSL